MRLIDADALADALFEKRKNYPQWVADVIGNMPTIDAIDLLKEQETVVHALDILRANGWKQEEPVCAHCEAVHVVLCKDCKHRLLPKGETRAECMARAGWFPVDDDWFCADGERKETE